jgi:hypothetical protein
MKRYIYVLVVIIMSIGFVACNESKSADTQDRNRQEAIQQEANRQVGMPAITNFTLKKNFKLIMEEMDKPHTIRYAYIWSQYHGKFVYIGKCEGFPIPAATQFTNPEKLVQPFYSDHSVVTLPQADPTGLFSPGSADASYVMMIDPETGKPVPCYFEEKVNTLPFKIPASVAIY